jgi:hypothetical protein
VDAGAPAPPAADAGALGRRVIVFRRPAALEAVAFLFRRTVRLSVHQNGLHLTDGRRHEVVLWEDVADIVPAFASGADPESLVRVTIRRRSGGSVVLRNDWRPRPEFRGLVARLLRWTEDEGRC